MSGTGHLAPGAGGRGGSRSRSASALRSLGGAPLSAWFGLGVVALYAIVALAAPLLARYGEAEIVGPPYSPWGADFPLGTDQLGRDVLTRLLFGARNTIGIALLTTLLSFALGGGLGLLAAIFRGPFDQILARAVDTLMAIPSLIFALILLSLFGSSVLNLVLIIAALDSAYFFRLARSVALQVTVSDFVEAARLRGESFLWIARREILPNIVPVLAAEFGLRFCFVFLTLSALSFLGIGIQPPTADWGSMVRENATLLTYGDPAPLIPAFAIALLTVGVNFVVDWTLSRSEGRGDEN